MGSGSASGAAVAGGDGGVGAVGTDAWQKPLPGSLLLARVLHLLLLQMKGVGARCFFLCFKKKKEEADCTENIY